MEGRRLISQMIIGGMTQYLAKVQGMPETALKTLETLIHKFMWNGESKPTVAMTHMSNITNEGGKKVLDIYARNKAIQLTWLQSYLKLDESRPIWALVADTIFSNNVPGELKSLANNPNARINQYLQTWHSWINKSSHGEDKNPSILQDLREMLKVGKKYGVRLEAINPELEARAKMPAIRNIQTKELDKPNTLNDKYGKCIRDKHEARSLKEITALSENVPRNHKKNKVCKCTKCTSIRRDTNRKCKHPNKCIERAAALINTLKDKWNPTIALPPDFLTHPEPDEIGPKSDLETMEVTYTIDPFSSQSLLKDCFRVFTNQEPPQIMVTRAPKTPLFQAPELIIYTDGSCYDNGEDTACAGSGIWYNDNNPRNTSLRVPHTDQSNQTGKLYTILHTLQSTPPDRALLLKTDSMYVVLGITKHLKTWENQGWMYSKHAEFFKSIIAWTRYRSNTTKITWVKGHSDIKGNEEANKLAGAGADQDMPPLANLPLAPTNTIPSGAKLSELAQKDFYYDIKKTSRPNPQKSSKNNLGRIQACTTAYYDHTPKYETIWRTTKHKDLTKKTQEFLWKCLHNTFKIGSFWKNIPGYENRSTCPHCKTKESMEHILMECMAPGRSEIWTLVTELWKKRSQVPIPENYGTILGCCLTTFKKANGKPDQGLNRLFRMLISKSMYLIWKLRCERAITWGNDPSKFHSPHKIHNEWVQTINARLKMDSIRTNTKIFKAKVIKPKIVLKTWKNCLLDNIYDTRNWCGKTGVLVSITPKQPPGQNR